MQRQQNVDTLHGKGHESTPLNDSARKPRHSACGGLRRAILPMDHARIGLTFLRGCSDGNDRADDNVRALARSADLPDAMIAVIAAQHVEAAARLGPDHNNQSRRPIGEFVTPAASTMPLGLVPAQLETRHA